MGKPSSILRAARERLGLSLQDLALQALLSHAHVRDLESYDDEVYMTLSLGALSRLLECLELNPSDLFGEPGAPLASFTELRVCIMAHCEQNELAPAAFEEQVGWDLKAFFDDPSHARDWNLDGLRDVCQPLNIDWRRFL